MAMPLGRSNKSGRDHAKTHIGENPFLKTHIGEKVALEKICFDTRFYRYATYPQVDVAQTKCL